jgi:light-harvesting complex I chlorophyll a/b binding protein 1
MRNPTLAFAAMSNSLGHRQFMPEGRKNPRMAAMQTALISPRPLLYTIIDDEYDEDDAFLMEEIARIESMDQIIQEFKDEGVLDEDYDLDDYEYEDDDFMDLFDNELLDQSDNKQQLLNQQQQQQQQQQPFSIRSAYSLEQALMQGVVPVSAGVGSGCLPGDLGFDPWDLSTKDYIGRAHSIIWNNSIQADHPTRPSALVLRDYREAEIRHGRLAMLAAIFWPVQEMVDRLLLDDDQFGSIIYSGITLPYIPLFMTALLLLLGYLDIYSSQMKEQNEIGEAFLPGDCFWDPLCILEGGTDRMKRNMSERELWNGRMAMLAVVLYAFEEVVSHKPMISIDSNSLLFEPWFEIPAIQEWLDAQFAFRSSSLP